MASKKPRPHDLLGNIKFVRITAVPDLPYAMAIQGELRQYGIGAVIINDERVQSRSDTEKRRAEAPAEGFLIEVPEDRAVRARRVLRKFEERDDEPEARERKS